MTAQTLIDQLQDFAPNAEVHLSVDSFVKGEPQSLVECEVVRIESVNGKPFLIGEKH